MVCGGSALEVCATAGKAADADRAREQTRTVQWRIKERTEPEGCRVSD